VYIPMLTLKAAQC